ncbi:MAG: hypothetical protein ACRDTV_17560, partial [Mycobacterium sp.]
SGRPGHVLRVLIRKEANPRRTTPGVSFLLGTEWPARWRKSGTNNDWAIVYGPAADAENSLKLSWVADTSSAARSACSGDVAALTTLQNDVMSTAFSDLLGMFSSSL